MAPLDLDLPDQLDTGGRLGNFDDLEALGNVNLGGAVAGWSSRGEGGKESSSDDDLLGEHFECWAR